MTFRGGTLIGITLAITLVSNFFLALSMLVAKRQIHALPPAFLSVARTGLMTLMLGAVALVAGQLTWPNTNAWLWDYRRLVFWPVCKLRAFLPGLAHAGFGQRSCYSINPAAVCGPVQPVAVWHNHHIAAVFGRANDAGRRGPDVMAKADQGRMTKDEREMQLIPLSSKNSTRGASMTTQSMPTLHDVITARQHVYRYIKPTPLYYYSGLSQLVDTDIWVKHENHHPVGAFKVRGGINLAANLTGEERKAGLFTASTGNHGQSIGLRRQSNRHKSDHRCAGGG